VSSWLGSRTSSRIQKVDNCVCICVLCLYLCAVSVSVCCVLCLCAVSVSVGVSITTSVSVFGAVSVSLSLSVSVLVSVSESESAADRTLLTYLSLSVPLLSLFPRLLSLSLPLTAISLIFSILLYLFLPRSVEGVKLTEVYLDLKVTAFRAALSPTQFLEPSFPTIAGVNGNGAIVHYR
jgi:hypothetical protein